MVAEKEAERGEESWTRGLACRRDPALGEAQALQHAGQRPWSPLSGPMRAGWRPGKLPTARAPGAWALWPMTGRRRSRGHAAIYSAVELEPVRPPRQSCGQRGSRQRLAALLAGAG